MKIVKYRTCMQGKMKENEKKKKINWRYIILTLFLRKRREITLQQERYSTGTRLGHKEEQARKVRSARGTGLAESKGRNQETKRATNMRILEGNSVHVDLPCWDYDACFMHWLVGYFVVIGMGIYLD